MHTTRRENKDWILKQLFKATGLVTIALLGGIFFMLLYNSIAFFSNIHPIDFFTGVQWNPANVNGKIQHFFHY